MNWTLYTNAARAEAAYTTAVERAYGKDACNARYDYARNGSRAASPLHTLYEARIKAIAVWNEEVRRRSRFSFIG